MRRYWLVVVACASLTSWCVYDHRTRPFDPEERFADQGTHGPSPGTSEYKRGLEFRRQYRKAEQAAAPYYAAGFFLLVLGLGVVWRALRWISDRLSKFMD